MNLLDHKLLVVSGKGGVGRTSTALALGLAAAAKGKRTCVVEMSGQQALAEAAGFSSAEYEARDVADNLKLMSLSPTTCVADFGGRKLGLAKLAQWFFESKLMTGFIASVPGLADLVQLGKIEDMINVPLKGEPVYDLVILDAPATGHGLTLLSSAKAMAGMTKVGPFYDLAMIIARFLADTTQTSFVLVTLPEVLPVNESLEFAESLKEHGASISLCLMNRTLPVQLPEGTREAPQALLEALGGDDAVMSTLRELATNQVDKEERQSAAQSLLTSALPGVPLIGLPLLPTAPQGPKAFEPLCTPLEVLS